MVDVLEMIRQYSESMRSDEPIKIAYGVPVLMCLFSNAHGSSSSKNRTPPPGFYKVTLSAEMIALVASLSENVIASSVTAISHSCHVLIIYKLSELNESIIRESCHAYVL